MHQSELPLFNQFQPSWPVLSQFYSLTIWGSVILMQFWNVVRHILTLLNVERQVRVTWSACWLNKRENEKMKKKKINFTKTHPSKRPTCEMKNGSLSLLWAIKKELTHLFKLLSAWKTCPAASELFFSSDIFGLTDCLTGWASCAIVFSSHSSVGRGSRSSRNNSNSSNSNSSRRSSSCMQRQHSKQERMPEMEILR